MRRTGATRRGRSAATEMGTSAASGGATRRAHARPVPDPRPRYLQSLRAPHLLALATARPICAALCQVMPDWGLHRVAAPTGPESPVSSIARTGAGRYRFHSWWSSRALPGLGLAGATCGAVADLVQSYCDARPDMLALDCAALRIGDRLVALTGPDRAARSTLAARLGCDPDARFFCDDVLPVLPDGTALALGVQPRLRLPLPASASPAFADHVRRHLTVCDGRHAYLHLPHQATFGTRAALAALILLRYERTASTRLHRLPEAEAAARLAGHSTPGPAIGAAHHRRIAALASGLVCLTLVYSDLEEAANLLRVALGGRSLPAAGLHLAPPLPPEPPDLPGPATSSADPGQRFARAAGVSDRMIGGSSFLWQMEDRRHFVLDPVTDAIWTLLAHPARGYELARSLAERFPDAPRDRLAEDLEARLGQLVARGLVRAGT